MFKSISLVLTCLFFNFIALAAGIDQYDEVVSLGSSCQAAWHLKAFGYRKEGYPLDWMVTPHHGLIAFIRNKGANFLDKENLKTIEVLQGEPSLLHVLDTKYDIHSIHDFYFPDMQNYESVKEKYKRRVERLFNLMKSNKKVLFIRVQTSRKEVTVLDAIIRGLFPRLSYTILALSDDPDAYNDWGLSRVKNFYMQQFPGNWIGDSERWREILSLFSIKSSVQPVDHKEDW